LLDKVFVPIKWGGNGVNLSCADGSNYEADKVIVTLPLGVLKNIKKDFFNPPLPLKKIKTIQVHHPAIVM
jgi:monoamine oxidase